MRCIAIGPAEGKLDALTDREAVEWDCRAPRGRFRVTSGWDADEHERARMSACSFDALPGGHGGERAPTRAGTVNPGRHNVCLATGMGGAAAERRAVHACTDRRALAVRRA